MRDFRRLVVNLGPLIDFEALAGFILLLVLLAAGLIFLIYKLAFVILPAAICALIFLGVVFVGFHLVSRATIQVRSSQEIAARLAEIRQMEKKRVPPERVWPSEERVRAAAQAQVNRLLERQRRLWPHSDGQRDYRRSLGRRIEELRVHFGVIPESSRWDRFVRLHLERPSVRWLGSHPKTTFGIGLFVFASLTAVMAAGLERFGIA